MIATLSKNMSVIFLYGVAIIFAGVLAYQMITHQAINNLAAGLVGSIVGQVLNSTGTQHGVNITNDTVSKTAIAQYPLGTHEPDNIMVQPSLIGATHSNDDNLVAQHLAEEAAKKDNKA